MTDAQFLVALVARANARGVVLASEATLLGDLHLNATTLRQLLDQAQERGAIEVLSPLPFLVAKIRQPWSGKKPNAPMIGPKTKGSVARAYSYSSLSQSQQMKESYRPIEDEALLQEILATLGESDPTTFRGAVRNYQPATIRLALDRVRRHPAIRRNRTALFRYLLPRIAKESPSTN